MACKVHPDRESVAICMTCQQELCEECRHVGPYGKSYCAAHLPADQPAADVEMPPRGDAASMTGAATESPILAALCYLCWILPPLSFVVPIIVLATDYKQSRFMRYHAFNGIFWGLAVLLALGSMWFAAVVAGLIGIPGILVWFFYKLRTLVGVVALVLSVVFALKANNRQDVRIPAISDLTDNQAK